MKKKINSIAGVTLIEILIGILISVIMMAAMFASYTAVNNTYRQVTDKAKISQSGRDIVGMIVRDVRMSGFKYFNDNIKTNDKHAPLIITKATNFRTECDKLEIVYGDVNYKPSGSPKYTYERFKITYECKPSTIPNKSAAPKVGGGFPPIQAFAIFKSKVKWNESSNDWWKPANDKDSRTFENELIVDYVQDLIFNAIDEEGLLISPPPTPSNAKKDYLYKIKTVDIALNVRSTKEFFRNKKLRKFFALGDSTRDGSGSNTKAKNDKFLRETIVVSAHLRNLGLQ